MFWPDTYDLQRAIDETKENIEKCSHYIKSEDFAESDENEVKSCTTYAQKLEELSSILEIAKMQAVTLLEVANHKCTLAKVSAKEGKRIATLHIKKGSRYYMSGKNRVAILFNLTVTTTDGIRIKELSDYLWWDQRSKISEMVTKLSEDAYNLGVAPDSIVIKDETKNKRG